MQNQLDEQQRAKKEEQLAKRRIRDAQRRELKRNQEKKIAELEAKLQLLQQQTPTPQQSDVDAVSPTPQVTIPTPQVTIPTPQVLSTPIKRKAEHDQSTKRPPIIELSSEDEVVPQSPNRQVVEEEDEVIDEGSVEDDYDDDFVEEITPQSFQEIAAEMGIAVIKPTAGEQKELNYDIAMCQATIIRCQVQNHFEMQIMDKAQKYKLEQIRVQGEEDRAISVYKKVEFLREQLSAVVTRSIREKIESKIESLLDQIMQ